jgi:hypothetical protein
MGPISERGTLEPAKMSCGMMSSTVRMAARSALGLKADTSRPSPMPAADVSAKMTAREKAVLPGDGSSMPTVSTTATITPCRIEKTESTTTFDAT